MLSRAKRNKMKSSAELRSTAPARYGGSRIKPTPKPANQLKALCSPSQMTVTSRGRLHTPVTATGLPSTRSFSSSRSRSPTAEVAGVPSETAGKHWRNVTAAVFEYLAIAAPVPRWEDVVAGRLKPNQPTMRCRLLNELLGNGGQAVVMKGVDLNTGRVFAMKEFHKKEKAEDASVLCLEVCNFRMVFIFSSERLLLGLRVDFVLFTLAGLSNLGMFSFDH
eukprot:RCo044426